MWFQKVRFGQSCPLWFLEMIIIKTRVEKHEDKRWTHKFISLVHQIKVAPAQPRQFPSFNRGNCPYPTATIAPPNRGNCPCQSAAIVADDAQPMPNRNNCPWPTTVIAPSPPLQFPPPIYGNFSTPTLAIAPA